MMDPDFVKQILDISADALHAHGDEEQHPLMVVTVIHDNTADVGDSLEAFQLHISTSLPGPATLKLLHDLAHETLEKFLRAGLN